MLSGSSALWVLQVSYLAPTSFCVMPSMGNRTQGRRRAFEVSFRRFSKGYHAQSEKMLLLRMVAICPCSFDNQRQTSLVTVRTLRGQGLRCLLKAEATPLRLGVGVGYSQGS